jgi:hypothetical protein
VTDLVYIAIDDTDVLDSRGTGHLARALAAELSSHGRSLGITRHQLLVDPRIPYTSHNSSACLLLRTARDAARLAEIAGAFLERNAARGSDPGLCVTAGDAVTPEIVAYGARAKQEIVTVPEAQRLAAAAHAVLSAHGGSGLGVIGALAAVGLRTGGNDGRFIDIGATRSLAGLITVARLRESGVEAFAVGERVIELPDDVRIDVGDWCRPVLRAGHPTLLLEEMEAHGPERWRAVARDHIRSR